MTTKLIIRRKIGNLAARSPLMRKGGVHKKSKTSVRHHQQKKMKTAINDWYKEYKNGK